MPKAPPQTAEGANLPEVHAAIKICESNLSAALGMTDEATREARARRNYKDAALLSDIDAEYVKTSILFDTFVRQGPYPMAFNEGPQVLRARFAANTEELAAQRVQLANTGIARIKIGIAQAYLSPEADMNGPIKALRATFASTALHLGTGASFMAKDADAPTLSAQMLVQARKIYRI